jgi:hypothetical protein
VTHEFLAAGSDQLGLREAVLDQDAANGRHLQQDRDGQHPGDQEDPEPAGREAGHDGAAPEDAAGPVMRGVAGEQALLDATLQEAPVEDR